MAERSKNFFKGLWWEKYFPTLISVLLSGISTYFYLFDQAVFSKLTSLTGTLFEATLQASVVMAGFLLTVMTIMGAIRTGKMRLIIRSGNGRRLHKYLKRSIYWQVFLIFLAAFTPFFLSELENWTIIPLIFLLSIAWLTTFRFMKFFVQVVED